ncbi:MAG: DUF1326 domain-containing protein [Alphaproteobacteria bacterium]|nr:DUF1326 domain-containing protein [Alphaproteobacteria bacterium]
MAGIDWRFEAVELATCNCDFSCPCQFNALPTHGDCRAAVGYRIDKGHFGDTALDGVVFAALWAWPGAIHEGSGEAWLIVDEGASEAQRKAIEALFHGEETEPGANIFSVFTNVVDTYHPTHTASIAFEADVEERRGSFSIPGVIEAQSEPIKNPVTGDPHHVRVTLPHGFEYHEAEYASGRATTGDSPIALDYSDSHAHFAYLTWTPTGPVHA